MAELEQKKLSELRVVDLRVELEKRDIDISGIKAVLVKKLSKALSDEGHDPDKYLFSVDPKNSTPMKKKKEDGKEQNDEEQIENEKAINQEKKSEPVKKDIEESIDEDAELTKLLQSDDECKNEESSSEEVQKEEPKDKVENKDDENKSNSKKENKVDISKTETKDKIESKPKNTVDKATKKEDNANEKNKSETTDVKKGKDSGDKDDKREIKVASTDKEVTKVETTKEELIEEDDGKEEDAEEDKKDLKEEIEKEEGERDESMEEGECKDDKDDELLEICDDDDDDQNEVKTIGSEKGMDDDIEMKLEDKSDINGMDTEDSIHLTIGEDEEKLMAGEDDLIEKKDVKENRSSGRGTKKQESSSRKTGDPRHISPDKAFDEKGSKSNYRNLWVSGLSSITRATDLKQVFSKLGKVVAAKVVTNAKTPGARCYGFVTMVTSEDAQNCIKGLNLTELHGRLISVEAVANKPNAAAKKPEEKRRAESPHTRAEDKKRKKDTSENLVPPGTEDISAENGGAVGEEIIGERENQAVGVPRPANSAGGEGSEKGSSSRSSRRGSERERHDHHSRSSRRPREHVRGEPSVLSFEQIKEERERQRRREKERALREEERRRREERDRQRIIEMRQRDEAVRLEREREKIRIERERLERERVELLRLERETLEREREDLKRQQLKLEEARRTKRTLSNSREPPYDERKRVAAESRRYEAEHVTSSHSATSTAMRYPERSATAAAPYRSSRDERERRAEEPSHRTKSDASRMSHRERYEPPPSKSEHRYGSESWMPSGGSAGSVSKGYGSHTSSSSGRDVGSSWVGIPGDRKGPDLPSSHWGRSAAQSDRWASSGGGGAMVAGGSSGSRGASGLLPHPVGPSNMMGGPMSMGSMSTYPQSAGDRFDAYKPMGSMPRKY